MKREEISVALAAARLLVQLDNGWLPGDFLLPGFAEVQVNQQPWPGSVAGIEREDDALVFQLRVARADWWEADNLHLTAFSAEGGQLEAEHSELTIQYGEPLHLTLRCRRWTYTPPVAPVLWVAPLQQVAAIGTPGNLWTNRWQGEAQNFSITGVRLATEQLVFYVLNTKRGTLKQALLILENPSSAPLTSAVVQLELPLLRVVLAAPMQPGVFYGLDAAGRTTAALAATHPQAALPVNERDTSMVPLSYSDVQARLCWLAPFFRRLHRAFTAANGVSAVSFSLTRYGHSLAPLDVDTQFELVAGAVWILANYLSGTAATPTTFSWPPLTEAEALPFSTRALDWLVGTYGSAGQRVSQELLAAVRELLHGTLADYDDPLASTNVVRQRYNRVQLLRRAYAVLLSQAIGYRGRLAEFAPYVEGEPRWRRPEGRDHTRPPGWLPAPAEGAAETAEAHQVFRAEADVTGLTVWPTFALPGLPADELLRAFAAFAEEVRYHSRAQVAARLRPLPRRPDEPLRLSFRLMVEQAPTTQLALFTLEMLKKGFEVQGWDERPVRVTTPKSLASFQQRLLASPEFAYQVERLLLLAEDIRRGEA